MKEIAPKYEEIENLLSHMPEPSRRVILGCIVSLAIESYNPVAFINTHLKIWRNATVCSKMISNASVFLGLNEQLTKEHLKRLIKKT